MSKDNHLKIFATSSKNIRHGTKWKKGIDYVPNVGDIILVMTQEDKMKSNDKFRLAKVVEVHMGSDNKCRNITAEYRLVHQPEAETYDVGPIKRVKRSLHQCVVLIPVDQEFYLDEFPVNDPQPTVNSDIAATEKINDDDYIKIQAKNLTSQSKNIEKQSQKAVKSNQLNPPKTHKMALRQRNRAPVQN